MKGGNLCCSFVDGGRGWGRKLICMDQILINAEQFSRENDLESNRENNGNGSKVGRVLISIYFVTEPFTIINNVFVNQNISH